MAGVTRVPIDEFTAALAGLDTGEFAAFVGELWAETGREVTVEPPVVTVGTGSDELRLLVVPAGREGPDDTAGVDAVVTAGDRTVVPEEPAVGPERLRKRLLYGVAPPAADRLCERFLGMPARSRSDTGGEPAKATEATGRKLEDGRSGPAGSRRLPRIGAVTDKPWAVVALAVLLLAVGGVVTLLGGMGLGGPAADPAGDGSGETDGQGLSGDPRGAPLPEQATDTPAPVATPTPTPTVTTTPATGGGPGSSDAADAGADRYAGLEPTCNRSYLHVVQIQMNALKYNDNETDDGIRTVRRFSSPRNQEAVGSFGQLVEIIKSETYAPMLAYGSATFTPDRTGEDAARVRVVTRVEGNATGRYVFRLSKQDGGQYDGCWMTDGVQSSAASAGPAE